MSMQEFERAFQYASPKPVSEVVELEDYDIHHVYIDQGRDQLAVFIHGSPGSWDAFQAFFRIDSLLEMYDVVSIDRPGFGHSEFGRPEPSIAAQASAISQVLDRFDQTNKIMIGHSLGGPVVSRLAMDYPHLVQGLILVAPSIDSEQEKYEWYRSWIDTKVGGWVTPTAFWVSNEEIMPLKSELQEMLPLWKNIKVPTIVIHGKKDMLVPHENAAFADSVLTDSLIEIRYLEDANHFIPWSHSEEIVQALMDLSIER